MGFRARRSLSEVRRVEVDIKERTNKRGGKGPTIRCNSDTGHKVMTSPTGQKPCRRRPLCVQSLVYKFIAHCHFILPRQRYSLRVGSLLQSLSLLLLCTPLSYRVRFQRSALIDFRFYEGSSKGGEWRSGRGVRARDRSR